MLRPNTCARLGCTASSNIADAPLHFSAVACGRSWGASSAVPLEQQDAAGSSRTSARVSPGVTRSPRVSRSFSAFTHNEQCALPERTRFAAAIHWSSLNWTSLGGITPRRIAQLSLCTGVWQQQLLQHSFAEAHPHPQLSHGYGCCVLVNENHRATTAGEGMMPKLATTYTAIITIAVIARTGACPATLFTQVIVLLSSTISTLVKIIAMN